MVFIQKKSIRLGVDVWCFFQLNQSTRNKSRIYYCKKYYLGLPTQDPFF